MKEKTELFSNAIYLEDSYVTIENIKIYGSPWQPRFGKNWGFNLERGEELKEKWEKIPDDIDILITHGPPESILDKTDQGLSVGCDQLFEFVMEKIKPKIHIFGHIHESVNFFLKYSMGMNIKMELHLLMLLLYQKNINL
jgi:Icc-related predicted phosphoesterase